MISHEKKELKKLQSKAEELRVLSDKEKAEIVANFAKKLIENQQDLPSDISKIVDEHFFDLI